MESQSDQFNELRKLLAAESGPDWRAVLTEAARIMGCVTATLHRLDPSDGMLKTLALLGVPDELVPKIAVIPIGKGIAGLAAEKREPVQICNLQTDTTGRARPDAKKTEVAGSVAIPVELSTGALLGTIGVGKREPHDFTGAETEVLYAIAAEIAPHLAGAAAGAP
ncbi:MAG: GAF domain-containing protein [Verrucomicrobiales bacterium]